MSRAYREGDTCMDIGTLKVETTPGTFTSFDDFLTKQLASDPEFQKEWIRASPGHQLSIIILRHRITQGISQKELARLLGMKASQVSRMEVGEVEPTFSTIQHVCQVLGINLRININPTGMVTIIEQ